MLDDAHRINQILLNKLDEVCREYRITYLLDSGSLLGAVRHQSFIPWDDDVDVIFTRGEYEKFVAIPEEVWGNDFVFVRCDEIAGDSFFDFVPRIFYVKESVPLSSQEKIQDNINEYLRNKLAIDIFILDEAYDSYLRQMMVLVRLYLLYGQAMGHRDRIVYSEYALLSRAVIFFLSRIGKRKCLKEIASAYDRTCRSIKKRGKSYFVGNYSPISYTKIKFRKEWYAVRKMTINSVEYNAPVGYHEILTKLYGDYMQLPPEEERVPTHVK